METLLLIYKMIHSPSICNPIFWVLDLDNKFSLSSKGAIQDEDI